jgi:integrase/recombinase XerD
MTPLPPTVQEYFTGHLVNQRRASPLTIASYRDAFCLLLRYAKDRTGREPSQLDFVDLDASLITGFLQHLETERANSVPTRNARLAAIHSFYRFAAYRHPEHSALIAGILAIPTKRSEAQIVSFLDQNEIDALLAAPDPETWRGRRDRALLTVAADTGLRVAELTGLCRRDVQLGTGAHITCVGKGRKQRATPLSQRAAAITRAWLNTHPGQDDEPLFPSERGGHLSSDAVQRLVTKHAHTATKSCPSVGAKHVSPHTLRHSCAMQMLRNGVDITVIALWLGHEKLDSTSKYLHADLTIKERALARTAPQKGTRRPARYRPKDKLLTFLEGL